MAASGIAEHNEARRKEMSMQRMAYRKKQLQSQLHEQFGDSYGSMSNNPIMDPNRDTYEQEVNQIRKVGSPPGIPGDFRHDPRYVDQQRRDRLRQQQLVEYSAKIPNRFTSTNYAAQW